jgi:hypothetical protein
MAKVSPQDAEKERLLSHFTMENLHVAIFGVTSGNIFKTCFGISRKIRKQIVSSKILI